MIESVHIFCPLHFLEMAVSPIALRNKIPQIVLGSSSPYTSALKIVISLQMM